MISTGKNHHWELSFGFLRDINMQDKDNELTSKAYAFLTCHTHSHTDTHAHAHTNFQPAVSTSAPCKLSVIPRCSDPCQACVTVWGTGLSRHPYTLSFPFVYLFAFVASFSGVCLHPVRLPLHLSRTPLWSQSDVLSFHLPPPTALLWGVDEHPGVGFHLSSEALSVSFTKLCQDFYNWLSFPEFICFCATKTSFMASLERKLEDY